MAQTARACSPGRSRIVRQVERGLRPPPGEKSSRCNPPEREKGYSRFSVGRWLRGRKPQGGGLRKPRVTLWEADGGDFFALKGRHQRIDPPLPGSVFPWTFPRAPPWRLEKQPLLGTWLQAGWPVSGNFSYQQNFPTSNSGARGRGLPTVQFPPPGTAQPFFRLIKPPD